MTDEEMVEVAREAAVAEAKRRGWMAPDEVLPAEDEPRTAASVNVALLFRRYLADLRGVPVPPLLDWRAFVAERREAEARGTSEQAARA